MLLQKYSLDLYPGSRHVFLSREYAVLATEPLSMPPPGITNATAYVLTRVTAANTQRVQIWRLLSRRPCQ